VQLVLAVFYSICVPPLCQKWKGHPNKFFARFARKDSVPPLSNPWRRPCAARVVEWWIGLWRHLVLNDKLGKELETHCCSYTAGDIVKVGTQAENGVDLI